MKAIVPAFELTLLCVACGLSACRDKPAASQADRQSAGEPSLSVLDLNGEPVDPFEGNINKANVFVFASVDCPISNRYAPTVRALAERFTEKGIRFWMVYPDPDTTGLEIEKHLKEYSYPMGALRDPDHSLVALSKAVVTPDSAVFTSRTELVYHGRIDNRFVDFGKERPAATQHDLADVLEAISEGRSVATPSAPGVGCYIADLK